MTPQPWQPDRAVLPNAWPHPPSPAAMGRGRLGRYPAHGTAIWFSPLVRVVAKTRSRGAALVATLADDAPPYFTLLVTGHVVVPLMFMVDRMNEPPVWIISAIFLPLMLIILMPNPNMLKSAPDKT